MWALPISVAVILAGLFPILIGTGAGSEVMSRIAAPMIGGMITAPLLSMFVLPAAYLLLRRPRTKRSKPSAGEKESITDRTRVAKGKSVSARLDTGERRHTKKIKVY